MAKRATKGLSVAELEQQLAEKRKELSALEKERDQLKGRLAEVDARISQLRGKKRATTKVRRKPRKRPKNKKPLKGYLLEILTKNKKGLDMNGLIKAIGESDYKTTSSNPRSVIYQCIYNHDEFVKDDKSGLYRLA